MTHLRIHYDLRKAFFVTRANVLITSHGLYTLLLYVFNQPVGRLLLYIHVVCYLSTPEFLSDCIPWD